ncbi:unnamed protein product [Ilex paraguariensis]|uniref:PsbQ-like protein 3, chloroplastic n=1 Tax=Ilex paraguariensis TaxID=185542 RepID=A0ABC8T254_9AQUA
MIILQIYRPSTSQQFTPVMVLIPPVQQTYLPYHFRSPMCHRKPSIHFRKTTQMILQCNISRRTSIVATTLIQLASEAIISSQTANAFDFRMTVPDQTLEEAESGIRDHAQSLLQVKDLLEAELWNEAQKELRKSSSYLKQDVYTIIQAKPGSDRPKLRKLYSTLFNNVTRLDYAARDKDAIRVREWYDSVVVALNDILSRI